MAPRQGILKLSRDDLAVVAYFETERLEPQTIEDQPEIARWDPVSDQPVVRQRYVKAAHEDIDGEPALPEGTTGYRWVNEDGDEVPSERLTYVQRTSDGSVEEVSKRPSTVLKDEPLPVEQWVDLDRVGSFLPKATYEIWGREAADEADLQNLAEYIDREGKTPMVVWMLQPAFLKSWGLIVPRFDEESERFSLIVQVTRKTIEPDHTMPIMAAEEVEAALAESEDHYVEQDVPG